MILRTLLPHMGVLVLAGALAFWAGEKPDGAPDPIGATLWDLEGAPIERIEYIAPLQTVVLERASDAQGVYFRGHSVTTSTNPETALDAGAGGARSAQALERSFVADQEMDDLLSRLNRLVSRRALGHLKAERLPEFGLGRDQAAMLKVVSSRGTRQLQLGDKTAGAPDVFARSADGGVFIIDGALVRSLRNGDTVLVQRALQGWDRDKAVRVRLTAGNHTREFVRVGAQPDFWADATRPAAKDETASNWLAKLERLRVSRYPGFDREPAALVRAEFLDDADKRLGFIELALTDSGAGDNAEYLARSETTRDFGVVLRSSGEALAADLDSVLAP